MDSGYQQEPVARGGVRFTVVPAAAPSPRLQPLVAAAIAAALAYALLFRSETPSAGLPLSIRAALAFVAVLGTHALFRHRAQRATTRTRSPGGSFVVLSSRIETASGAIARADLHRLVVTNRHGGSLMDPRARDVSYALCAESTDGRVILAGGMRQHTALGLLADVSRVLRVPVLSAFVARSAR